MPVEYLSLDAAATPWSAASFCMEHVGRTVLFEHQGDTGEERAHSILLCAPKRWIVEGGETFIEGPSGREVDDPLRWMKQQHQPCQALEPVPFIGGLAGYLGFEQGWRLDTLQVAARSAESPDLWVGLFEASAVFDHRRRRWGIYGRSGDAVQQLADVLRRAPSEPNIGPGESRGESNHPGGISPASYRQGVSDAVEAIYAGDLFEVNFTDRIRTTWRGDRRAIYAGLRQLAPGDFGGLIAIDELLIASVSPEQFLCVEPNGRVITRPVKGTRPRGETIEEDRALAEELLMSRKDRAENIMIVDLMRNDLTRVCKPGSVRTSELCGLHSFSSIHHLISTVEGRLSERFDALDAFLASFPAGSITGAPKLRAMEWIAANERSPRGPYTGSMFYWSDHGRLDSNVLIRSAVLSGDRLEYGTGGAVVADSSPPQEYDEALWKAQPFLDFCGE